MIKSELIKSLTAEDAIFITGTDTEVGKTYCTALLIKLLSESHSVNPFKIISAGVDPKAGINEDAFELHQACSGQYSIEQINPLVLQQPIAPHIAARNEGVSLDYSVMDSLFTQAKQLADLTLVEGAGGWNLPLNDDELLSDWVAEQAMPVILVVGIRLGCLNHALLTAEAIASRGCKIIGWIANYIDGEPDAISNQNVDYLMTKLNKLYSSPLLTTVKHGQTNLFADYILSKP